MSVEAIREFCDCRGSKLRVDRNKGIIEGVKILGLESRNGRTYTREGVARAVARYESAKVNVNHPSGAASSPRNYEDRMGVVRNVRVDHDGGLRGDFHFNPKHALAEQLIWDAEHAPENVGFSHNVEARVARKNGREVVEEITKVVSVDLVADPATTRGLSETFDPSAEKKALVERMAELVGLPAYAIPPLDGGLAWREIAAEIRAYLESIRQGLVAAGYFRTPKSDANTVAESITSAKQFGKALRDGIQTQPAGGQAVNAAEFASAVSEGLERRPVRKRASHKPAGPLSEALGSPDPQGAEDFRRAVTE